MEERTNINPKLLKRKKKKNIIREVYLYDDLIVKRFIKLSPLPDMRRLWRMEHRALKRLSGLPVPESYGFVEKGYKGVKEIIFARQFIKGDPIHSLTQDDLQSMALMMAEIHKRGVITRDPHLDNFLRDADGKILFFDFGRALVLNPKNPLLILLIGKELARILFHSSVSKSGFRDIFLDYYFQYFPITGIKRAMVEKICRKWEIRIKKNK